MSSCEFSSCTLLPFALLYPLISFPFMPHPYSQCDSLFLPNHYFKTTHIHTYSLHMHIHIHVYVYALTDT